MLQNLKALLNPTPQPEVKVTITRDTIAAGRTVSAGQVITLPQSLARELIGAGAADEVGMAESQAAELARLNALLPPIGTPAAPPESFKGLPDCFTRWWSINIGGILLENRNLEIFDRLIAKGKLHSMDFHMRDTDPALDRQDGITRQKALQRIAAAIEMTPAPEQHTRELRYLRDALQRAETAVRDWQETHQTELARMHLACSDHTLETHGSLCREIGTLHGLARDLFAHRIGALGLSDHKVESLFGGSADAVKFASIRKCSTPDLRLAWAEANGEARHYIAAAPPAMAQLIEGWEVTRAEVARLTKQAKTELAAAKKVSAAA